MNREAFIAAYRARLAKDAPWASDTAQLDRVMAAVVETLTTKRTSWSWDGPYAREVWRALGGKGRLTLKALRALPSEPQASKPMQCGKCAAIGTNTAGPPRHAPGCVNDDKPDAVRVAVAAYYTEPTFPLRYRTHSIMRDGTEWTSPEAFDAQHAQHIAQACIAGHLKGSHYWCTEEGTGRFLNGIGKDGNWITSSPLCASAVAPSGYDTIGRAVYYPAVRIYSPHPRLTYRRIRGSAHTLVAYDTRDASLGPEPVGWVLGEDVPAGAVVS